MRLLASLFAAVSLSAQSGFFPLAEVRPGMEATGKTVFSGDRIEDFQVEILGVLENVGPRQSLVLARLSGGPLASTGVLQGMSGSPVYIGGRLLGAVAMAFAYSKEPVAAIRPIQDLIQAGEAAGRPLRARASLTDNDLTHALEEPGAIAAGGARLVDIATPVSFGGFTRTTVERFAPRLRALGLEPQQGISGGGRLKPAMGDPARLQPGSMISVQLMTGDMSVGADGTVTYIDGRRIYAFGHRFLSLGATEVPFARSEVLALLPNMQTSFKISSPVEWMGAILADRTTGVAGELGRRAGLIPLAITVASHGAAGVRRQSYQMEMVNDSILSPVLVQMALTSAIEATERSLGEATLAVRGEIRFVDGAPPLRVNSAYAGDQGLPQSAALGPASTLAYALQSGFESLRLQGVTLEVDSYPDRRQAQIEQAWPSRRVVAPGETVELTVVLRRPSGEELTRKASYAVPVGAVAGPLYFTVADSSVTNTAEYRQFLAAPPRSPAQLLSFLNSLRENTKAYVRVWRADAGYEVQGRNLPAPPPSADQILARAQAGSAPAALMRNAKIGEIEIDAGGLVVNGSLTVQVDIK